MRPASLPAVIAGFVMSAEEQEAAGLVTIRFGAVGPAATFAFTVVEQPDAFFTARLCAPEATPVYPAAG